MYNIDLIINSFHGVVRVELHEILSSQFSCPFLHCRIGARTACHYIHMQWKQMRRFK